MGVITGQRIKLLREEHGYTQRDFAKVIGINNSVLSRIEAGIRPVEDELLSKFASFFHCTADYLLGRSDFRRGRLVTDTELKEFLPPEVVNKNKIEMWVDEAELKPETKKEITELLKKHGYL
ncbi:helix-turn-helix domain-containing protein [Dethiobacter alkaliphilus]|uniref:Transcriptional regulator, XRE family n=1 Tax=Dethiobacter alkaliphilus AHT 1 TaxID=555088 RepID=C0GG27_DETAL|nr:helix-turn-helix transcriptional regulator [Dethiobacter alkaliphilus]EEG77716.1 transcriptional regulator, XRE family [Dethiobacter alkaliphilus AHT 1]